MTNQAANYPMERVVFPRNPNYSQHPCFTPCGECRANGRCELQTAHAAQQRKTKYITPEIAQMENERMLAELSRWAAIRKGLQEMSENLHEFHDLFRKAKKYTNNFQDAEKCQKVKDFYEKKYKPKFNPDDYFILPSQRNDL